jgi:hypothetical protein
MQLVRFAVNFAHRRHRRRLALQPVDVDPDAADALLESQADGGGGDDVKDVQACTSIQTVMHTFGTGAETNRADQSCHPV